MARPVRRREPRRTLIAMRVLGIVWVGTRTDAFDETVAFFRDVLGLAIEPQGPDVVRAIMPDTSKIEIFGPADADHPHFTTGPVPEFLVEDVTEALGELQAAGIEILGTPVLEGDQRWVHFRAPDGNVYGLTAASSYARPASG